MSDVIAIAKSLARLREEVESEETRQRVVEALDALSEFCLMTEDAEAASLANKEVEAVRCTFAAVEGEAAEPGDQRGEDQAADYIERFQAAVDKIIAWEIDRTLAELAVAAEGFPGEEIERIRSHRELFIPRMLESCEAILGDLQQRALGDADGFVEMIVLLLEFEVEQAFPLTLRALTLPEDDVEAIFGDFMIPLLARTLAIAVTRDRHYLSGIERVAEATDFGSFRPWGAVTAYRYLLRDGTLTRQEVVERLEQYLRVAIARGASDARQLPAVRIARLRRLRSQGND